MNCRKCKCELPNNAKYCPSCGAKVDAAKKPKSRGNGTGSVYQLPNKTWTVVRTVGYKTDPNGKTRRVTRSKSGFKTKREAVNYFPKLFLDPAEAKAARPKTITFKKLYDTWQPTHRVEKKTMYCYTSAIKYFEPVWLMSLDDITIDDLQDCVDDCPRGRRTRENMKALCNLLYKFAIPRHLTELNLAPYLIVSGEHGSKHALPDDYVKIIRDNVGKVPYADYVLCQCYLGFRPSEFIALDAKLYNRKEKAFTGGSKTDAGKDRVVTVPPVIQPIINRLTNDKISGPVFCKENGKPLNIKEYRAKFYAVLDSCGLDNPTYEVNDTLVHTYTPHSCRRTFATMMKRVEGADKDKLELIGHTSNEMLRYYQDVSFDDLRKITDKLA